MASQVGEMAAKRKYSVEGTVEDDRARPLIRGASEADKKRGKRISVSRPSYSGGLPERPVRPLEAGAVKYRI